MHKMVLWPHRYWISVENEGRLAESNLGWTSNVPMIVGSVLTKSGGNMSTGIGWADHNKNEWTDEEVWTKLVEQYGENAQAVAIAFSALYPDKKLADAYYIAPRGVSYRNGVKTTATKKIESGTAPVFNYMMTYEVPVNGGTTAGIILFTVSESWLLAGETVDGAAVPEKKVTFVAPMANTGY